MSHQVQDLDRGLDFSWSSRFFDSAWGGRRHGRRLTMISFGTAVQATAIVMTARVAIATDAEVYAMYPSVKILRQANGLANSQSLA